MNPDTETPPAGPRGWVGVSVREEKFWRDIGARVLAGVITAAIVYAGALLLGYLHTPEIGAGLLLGLGIFACSILVGASVVLLRTRSRTPGGGAGVGRLALAALLLLAACAIAAGVASDLLSP